MGAPSMTQNKEMIEPTQDVSDADLDRLADKLLKKMKEKQKQESDENTEKERPYAICNGCRRLLTRAEYLGPSCPACLGKTATIIKYDDTAET